MVQNLNLLLRYLLVGASFVASYSVPYHYKLFSFVMSTSLILLCLEALGIAQVFRKKLDRKSSLSIVVLLITFFLGMFIIKRAASNNGIVVIGSDDLTYLNVLIPVFQVLNEEILLRAALLTRLESYFRYSLTIVFGSILFSLLHFGLYGLGQEHTILSWTTLCSLFFFSLLTNAIFIDSGNLIYCYMIHLGWNIARFRGKYYSPFSHLCLREGESFNLIEGSEMVLILTITACISYYIMKKLLSKSRQVPAT